MSMADDNSRIAEFWSSLQHATDPTAYTPLRRQDIVAARLEAGGEPYYVLKDPLRKNYLRLSENDYALWWQMDGCKSVKDLLYYNLLRYRSLPIGHLKSLVTNLRTNHFLQDEPTDMYGQVAEALTVRAPASRGRRLLNGFFHTEIDIEGLDDFFTPLYQSTRWLFSSLLQSLFLLLIIAGGGLFGWLVLHHAYALSPGPLAVASLFVANLFVIAIHELAHGLATKHFGRELNRGGFLIYWGFPAFFVDTRDTWLSPRLHRMAVSWAGPHSGLILGGITGLFLTAIAPPQTLLTTFIYQVGFISYLSVFVNLNPLLELDGYFILMDWLEMPGLRHRAIRFWRQEIWNKMRGLAHPLQLWRNLSRTERIFLTYGALTLVYSTYALGLAFYFWRTRLLPIAQTLWAGNFYGAVGQWLLLAIIAGAVLPTLYYLFLFSWHRLQAGLEWLARRDLLSRPDVLALLTGLPLLIGLPMLLISVNNALLITVLLWLLHLGIVATFVSVAQQLPGSRFQWAMWSLVLATISLALSWIMLPLANPLWRDLSLILFAAAILATGTVAWFTVSPRYIPLGDRVLMGTFLLLGLLYTAAILVLENGRLPTTLPIIIGTFLGLILMSPLLLNFRRSIFALPWGLITLAILAVPWLQSVRFLHLPIAALWLYAGLLYLLIGALAEFKRHEEAVEESAVFSERQRLINSFNHFMTALFASYETIFGGRRLADIQSQMFALGPLDPDATIFEIATQIREALLLAVDRLDDLAGTAFTRKAGQAAYDSLPWLEIETLGRHILAETDWGSQLAAGFIRARDSRESLIRQADIFAGLDHEGVAEVTHVAEIMEVRAGTTIARVNTDATHFYLIESGEVGVFHNGLQLANLEPGGYFGIMALQDSGNYLQTYRALTPVYLLAIDRRRFNPLLRADTTMAQQVSSGRQERQLLKKMLLFSSLSPQEIAAIDARLQPRQVKAGELIVRQNQPRSHLIIVASGQIEIVQENDDGSEQILGTLGMGEHFGEYALFADVPYPATCRAVTDSKLLLLDEPTFDRLVAGSDRMSHYVEQIGSGRLIATRRRAGVSALLS
jgi:putative peptide zinc metalloprotease protein